MMNILLISVVAFTTSCIGLFTGFGLGTVLLPVFALFLPATTAVYATALVHGANNVLKTTLLGRYADFKIVLWFGLPAIVASYLGAKFLMLLSGTPFLLSYQLWGLEAQLTPLKLTLGMLILGFAILELHPALQKISFPKKYLPLGGLLSGFFGGLSGHQGALRSAFLGVWVGKKLLHKVTWGAVQILTGTLLMLLGIAMATGII